jgi:hypothetical protein
MDAETVIVEVSVSNLWDGGNITASLLVIRWGEGFSPFGDK